MFQRSQRSKDVVTLPIDKYRKHILYLLETHQVLIVVGETGSGKSTRIPQFLFSAGIYNLPLKPEEREVHDPNQNIKYKQICITQPRRVVAMQLAQRVAQNLGCTIGSTVGYAVRFTDVTNPEETQVKFMTEGLLIREMLLDPLLKRYSVIIVDEAHERNLSTDLLLGLLKCILAKRTDLSLIICSATLDIDGIREFFTISPKYATSEKQRKPALLWAHGKSYPLKIFYRKEPVPNYVEAAVETAVNIHETIRLASGKILIFLTGQDEVEHVVERLNDYARASASRLDLRKLLALPLHASLKSEAISRAFDEHGRDTRVCIVATNVAETSLTIDGIAYVIDCGFVKQKMFDQKTGTETLDRVTISKSSAKQRAGRAGRTREGVVYRLYTESGYEGMNEFMLQEIQRSPLMEVVMMLKSLGVNDVQRFPLISPMPRHSLVTAFALLYALQAIDETGQLTKTGQLMATFNLDPRISKSLVSLESSGCTREICKIVSMLQVKEIYTKPTRHASSIWTNTSLTNICASEGDTISYLNILNGFMANQKSQNWAAKRNLNFNSLINATEILNKLERQLERCGINLTSSQGRTALVQKALVSGLFSNVAYLHPSGDYKTIRGEQTVYVHPTSIYSEMTERPKYVIFVEILNTTKPFMRHIMSIEHTWLMDIAPHFYKFATSLEMTRLESTLKTS